MPWINDGINGQGKEFGFDAGHQLVKIAGWQIGTSDGIPEQHIAGDHKSLGLIVKANAPCGMAGGKKHFQGGISPMDCFAFFQEPLWLRDIADEISK